MKLDSCLVKLDDKSLNLFNFEFDLRNKTLLSKEETQNYKWGEAKFDFLCSGQYLRFKDEDKKSVETYYRKVAENYINIYLTNHSFCCIIYTERLWFLYD